MAKQRHSNAPIVGEPDGTELHRASASIAEIAPMSKQGRRAFLRNAALVGAGGGAAVLAGMRGVTFASATTRALPPFRITLSGTGYTPVGQSQALTLDPDGGVDSQPAIQAAINDCQNQGGGIVELPAGNFLLQNHGLLISDAVILQGTGWSLKDQAGNQSNGAIIGDPVGGSAQYGAVLDPAHVWAKGSEGTYLIVGSSNPDAAIRIAPYPSTSKPNGAYETSGAAVRDLAIIHQQNDPTQNLSSWVPRPIPSLNMPQVGTSTEFAIKVEGAAVDLENIFILNATGGIYVVQPNVDSSSAAPIIQGQMTFRRIYCGAIARGIVLDSCGDVIRLEDIHLWPFWYSAGVGGQVNPHDSTQPGVSNVNAWRWSNGVGLQLMRCDDSMFSNIFILGYRVGIEFSVGGQISNDGSAPEDTPTFPATGLYDAWSSNLPPSQAGAPEGEGIGLQFSNVVVDQAITGIIFGVDTKNIWASFSNLAIYCVPSLQGTWWGTTSMIGYSFGWGILSQAISSRLMFSNVSIEGPALGCIYIAPASIFALPMWESGNTWSPTGADPTNDVMIKNIVMIDNIRMRWWNGNSTTQQGGAYGSNPYYAIQVVPSASLGANSDPFVYVGNRALNLKNATVSNKYTPLPATLTSPGVFLSSYSLGQQAGAPDWI